MCDLGRVKCVECEPGEAPRGRSARNGVPRRGTSPDRGPEAGPCLAPSERNRSGFPVVFGFWRVSRGRTRRDRLFVLRENQLRGTHVSREGGERLQVAFRVKQ